MIGLQNLPGGFNAWRELAAARVRTAKGVLLMSTRQLIDGVRRHANE
ncbi:MAG: hypothetical protein OXI79_17760 [Gammaproteobacteria bacterium]|nr:hypothetical protein [Gammaproteobacteria bacterium]